MQVLMLMRLRSNVRNLRGLATITESVATYLALTCLDLASLANG